MLEKCHVSIFTINWNFEIVHSLLTVLTIYECVCWIKCFNTWTESWISQSASFWLLEVPTQNCLTLPLCPLKLFALYSLPLFQNYDDDIHDAIPFRYVHGDVYFDHCYHVNLFSVLDDCYRYHYCKILVDTVKRSYCYVILRL